MYSVVLMAALTSGSATPDFGRRGNGCYGGCYGCNGCYGGGYGWGRGHGGYGGCYGGYGGCYGCYGGWSCYGGCYGYSTYSPYHPIMPGAEKVPAPDIKEKVPAPGKKDESTSSPRATLVVEVPADAKLFIDDQPMKTTSAKRTFQTPPLQPGQQYYYMVRVEVVRDGEVKTETRRVIIRPGEEARAAFPNLETTVTTVQSR